MVAQQATIADIETYLDGFCAKVPGTWGQECNRLSSKVAAIVEFLKANQGPVKYCSQMGICLGH